MKVEALIRRYTSYKTKPQNLGEEIRLSGGVTVNPEVREAYKNGTLLNLSGREIDFLIFLAKNRGRVVSPKEIYENIWNEVALSSANNTVTVQMLALRRKLEDDPSQPKIIRTIWGKGYQID